jgi:hypothetical protein
MSATLAKIGSLNFDHEEVRPLFAAFLVCKCLAGFNSAFFPPLNSSWRYTPASFTDPADTILQVPIYTDYGINHNVYFAFDTGARKL